MFINTLVSTTGHSVTTIPIFCKKAKNASNNGTFLKSNDGSDVTNRFSTLFKQKMFYCFVCFVFSFQLNYVSDQWFSIFVMLLPLKILDAFQLSVYRKTASIKQLAIQNKETTS